MLRMTNETKVEPTLTAADTQAGALLAPSADAGKPAGLPETELARLTDEVIGALKTVYDPEPIQNARLFSEIEEKSRQLESASQQSPTGERPRLDHPGGDGHRHRHDARADR